MLSLEKGRVIEILQQGDKTQMLNVENTINGLIERAINYIEETGICSRGDLVIINTVGNKLNLGTGGYNIVYYNTSLDLDNEVFFDRKNGHIIKMKYTQCQVKVKSVEENTDFKNIFENHVKLLQRPVVFAILHSMISPLVRTIKCINNNINISCVYTYGGAMNANNSFSLKRLKEEGLINSVITTGECYGGDYEAINITTGIMFGLNQLKNDIIIVCSGPGIAGSSTYYGFSTFDLIGSIYITKQLGLLPILIPRISLADQRERHIGVSMQSIAILQTLDFPIHVVLYRDNEDMEGFRFIHNQFIKYNVINKHIFNIIDDGIIKENIDFITEDTRVMGRSYIEDPYFFYNCCSTGVYAAKLLNKIGDY